MTGAERAAHHTLPSWFESLPGIRHMPEHWRPNPRIPLVGAPVVVFYVLTRLVNAELAIAGGFIAFTIVFFLVSFSRLYRGLAFYGYLITAGAALVGILWGSEKAYLAAGPAQSVLILPVYAGSLIIGKPLIGAIARDFVPGIAGGLAVNAPVFVWITVGWAVYHVVRAPVLSWMLVELSVGEYIVLTRVVWWPITAACYLGTGWLIIRAVRRQERRAAPVSARAPA